MLVPEEAELRTQRRLQLPTLLERVPPQAAARDAAARLVHAALRHRRMRWLRAVSLAALSRAAACTREREEV